jgi:BirA family biotin operon repressor/biotin-[acetyl-CoA-carboxylase] ligase
MPLLESYHLLSYENLDSTNEEAKRLAHGGGGHGAVLWAKRQSQGRGRMGRPWVSMDGNLFVSVLLSPEMVQSAWPQLSFVASLAVHDAIGPLLPDGNEDLRLKWPNDLLLGGRKIGGILLESFATPAKDGRPAQNWVVVGVGVNVESAPEDTEIPAIYLKDAGVEIVSAKIVLSRFIHHFIQRYDQWEKKGFTSIQKEWMKAAHPKGTPMRARLMTETLHGTFAGLDGEGYCQLKLADGSARSISAGDVFFEYSPVGVG